MSPLSELLFPLKFQPIYVPKIWGGNRLARVLSKNGLSDGIGESWEISGVKDHVSFVRNGSLAGMCLIELIQKYQGAIVGEKVYEKHGEQFPILIKFLDAKVDLSIQVHPNDLLAYKRHQSKGKTEMWYILEAEQNAKIIAGFSKKTKKEDYLKALENHNLVSLLDKIDVKKGDAYFIEPGTVHTIGAGVLLAEIQQTSDITYRLYDWNRSDQHGNQRELHTDLALDAIDFNKSQSIHLTYDQSQNQSNLIKSCSHFTTNYLPINGQVTKNYKNIDSFVIYICVSGSATISIGPHTEQINKGETVLLPAICDEVIIDALDTELLEVHM